ncbi:hypothetical protein HYPSUDRAFT_781982 [Hypholoma sublateritium FD-334 SS-4]|uniref:Uncharacterized protein n=1 Tax=Hypholoma sublateritium (strain FD-334 SS-4) TaxID=945553 RepID=A0A0D2L1P6_HYPSF|nr:hypothetical protein HYPSUDRAFT_781982 [Hypholoma sublateritium FD-334 SS-4]
MYLYRQSYRLFLDRLATISSLRCAFLALVTLVSELSRCLTAASWLEHERCLNVVRIRYKVLTPAKMFCACSRHGSN